MPGDEVDLVDVAAVWRWHTDNPTDQFGCADRHWLIDLGASGDAVDARSVTDRGGHGVRGTGGDGHNGEMSSGVSAVVRRLHVAKGIVTRDEQQDTKHHRHTDGDDLRQPPPKVAQ